MLDFALAMPVVLVVLYLINCVKILNEYERGVVFRLGRMVPQPLGPGLKFIIFPIDRLIRISLRTITLDVPPQDVITRDNVSIKVNAVIYFRVINPNKAIVEVEDYLFASSQMAQTTLRSVLGQVELDELLIHREKLNQQLQTIIDKQTDPWGVKVSAVEIKQVDLPEEIRRAMARRISSGRSTCLISTADTLTPHGSVCLSMSVWSFWLRLSRWINSSSSSTWPNTLRRVVCAICDVA